MGGLEIFEKAMFTLAGTGYFSSFLGTGGGGIRPPRVWPLIELELRGKNERVGLYERKTMVPNFKVSGQPTTSEVRSNARSGPPDTTIDTTIFGMLPRIRDELTLTYTFRWHICA